MPILSWAHSQYWSPAPSTFVPPPPGPGRPGYAGWQAGVVSMGPFGYLSAWWHAWSAWVRDWWRLCRRVAALPEPRRVVLLHVLSALEGPIYPYAKRAVRETATTIGFRDPYSWTAYSRDMKSNPAKAENIWRGVRARTLTQEGWAATAPGSTTTRLRNPDLTLITELAYQEYARFPWRE